VLRNGRNTAYAKLVRLLNTPNDKSAKKEEGRRKREEGRRKKEEGRRKKEEGKLFFFLSFSKKNQSAFVLLVASPFLASFSKKTSAFLLFSSSPFFLGLPVPNFQDGLKL
jgi:hypothetical protein